jgi:hypothetical protein
VPPPLFFQARAGLRRHMSLRKVKTDKI